MAGRSEIEFLPSAVRELEALPREAQGRVGDAIEAWADEPRPSTAKLLSGTGRERIWRIPVGPYRVLYQVTDVRVTVAIVRVADRREVYNATAIRRLLCRMLGEPTPHEADPIGARYAFEKRLGRLRGAT